MAVAPVLVPIESRSTNDAEALRFQRLERVRAQRRARRRYRLFLGTMLATTLVGAGILGVIAIRRTSFERLGFLSSPAPVEMVKPAAAAPAPTGSALGPPSEAVPQPARAEDRAARPRPNREGPGAVVPSRDEPRDAEVGDPAAAIDWLLKRRGHDAAYVPNGGEEKLQ